MASYRQRPASSWQTVSAGCVVGRPGREDQDERIEQEHGDRHDRSQSVPFCWKKACNRSGNVYLSLDRMNTMTTGPSFHACRKRRA